MTNAHHGAFSGMWIIVVVPSDLQGRRAVYAVSTTLPSMLR